MIINAEGSQEDIETLMRAIRSRMSIEEWDVEIDEGGVSVEIEAGAHVTAVEAADRLGLTKGRISQLFSDGVLDGYRQEGSVFVSAGSIDEVRELMEERKARSALDQGFTVFGLGKGGNGRGGFIAHVDGFDEVKALAEEHGGVYVIGDIDKLETVLQPD